MSQANIQPSGRECPFGEEELIVTKTDVKGHITYANDVFLRLSKYPVKQVIGAPHCLIRHPDMPRCIFKLLWDTIQAKQEIFAYVVNMASDGDHYWVFAHVTPTLDAQHNVIGFHSNRRKPRPEQVAKIKDLYRTLSAAEGDPASRKDGLQQGCRALTQILKDKGLEYDEFIFAV